MSSSITFNNEEKQAIRDLLKAGLGFHILDVGMSDDIVINTDGISFLNGAEEMLMMDNVANESYSKMIEFYLGYKGKVIIKDWER